jgi:hypothetical protein
MSVCAAIDIQLFHLRLSPEQSGKVEYERERLLGIANKCIHLSGGFGGGGDNLN